MELAKKRYTILVVCTGNTCRSPMVHGLLSKMVSDERLSHVQIKSAGTGTLDGYPASTNSVLAVERDGIDISDHHSTELTPELIDEADIILTLSFTHMMEVIALNPRADGKIAMLKSFPDREPSPELTVADPVGKDFDAYLKTYDEIKTEVNRIWPSLKKRIEKHSK